MPTIVYYARTDDFAVVNVLSDELREAQIDNDGEENKKKRRLAWMALTAAMQDFARQKGIEPPQLRLVAGKRWTANDAYISLAHCDTLAVAVISDVPVGIDCEPTERTVPRRLAERIALPQEKELSLQTNEGMLRFWTAKEAAFKASEGKTDVVSKADVTKFCITYAKKCDTLIAVATSRKTSMKFVRLYPDGKVHS